MRAHRERGLGQAWDGLPSIGRIAAPFGCGRDPDVVAAIARTRRNPRYLSDPDIPALVSATGDLRVALGGAACAVFAVPSHVLRAVARDAVGSLESGAIAVSAVKGLESGSLARMSQVLEQELGGAIPVVVCRAELRARSRARAPAAVLAARRCQRRRGVQGNRGPAFRMYASETSSGSRWRRLKNVIALPPEWSKAPASATTRWPR